MEDDDEPLFVVPPKITKTYKVMMWQPINTAPKDGDYFILLYCAEDKSRWLAKWQGDRWYGVDDLGLTREGYSYGDPNVFTGWAINAWMALPPPPVDALGQPAQTEK